MRFIARKNNNVKNPRYVVGVDEVGRGCLAGPVTVAAVAAPVNSKFEIRNSKLKLKVPLKDSKKLTAEKREEWFKYIKNHPKIFYAKASVYPKIIDRINITQAANLAATRALKKLLATSDWRLVNGKLKVLLDGGLFVNQKSLITSGHALVARTIVKGDEKFNCVKLASIVAKVSRDRVMRRNHKKFPQYGFDQHVGYGTKTHIAVIKKHGYCELHRLSFLKNFVKSV